MPLLLALVWGGSQYPWGSGEIIGMLVAAGVALLLFIWRERKAKDPILSLGLFRNKVFAISSVAVFLSALGMFGSILFIPVFAQGVIGYSATNSGLVMMPMMLSIVFASVISGQIVSRTGNYKILSIIGMAVATVGMLLFSQINEYTTSSGLVFRMMVMGLGLGVTMPIFTLAVQNAFSHERLGEVTAGTQLFRSVGGTVGAAVLGGVMNAKLAERLIGIENDPFITAIQQVSPTTPVIIDGNTIQGFLSTDGQAHIQAVIQQAPAGLQEQLTVAFNNFLDVLRDAFSISIDQVFLIGAALMAIATIAVIFLPQIALRKSHNRPVMEEAGVTLDLELGQSDKHHEPNL